MQKRTLNELNLIDDFLFTSVMTYPDIGENFVRIILQIIFGREFGKVKVTTQKVYYGADTNLHGTRMDVYIEEEPGAILAEESNIFDLEPEKNSKSSSILSLPKRVRFYHARIDSKNLKSGQSYRSLKNVIVILIMPFDPFDLDRMIYTIRNLCEEEPSMPYEDGARTLFLYTKGTKGNPSEELRQLMRYMEHTTQENAVNPILQDLQKMVETVKHDEEVSISYMKIFEKEEMIFNEGQEHGRELERINTERERQRADEADKRAAKAAAQADAADKQAAKAAAQADAANKRAALAEAELRRLKAELASLKGN